MANKKSTMPQRELSKSICHQLVDMILSNKKFMSKSQVEERDQRAALRLMEESGGSGGDHGPP